jgi:hypothetical protein
MTLSEVQTNVPLLPTSLYVPGQQYIKCDFALLTRSAQLNVLADRLATTVLKDPCTAKNPTELYLLPA